MFEKPPITVLGVGNILLSDEGLGVHVVRALQEKYEFSSNVQLLDGGTMGMELLHYIGDAERILLIDCISGGEKPGTVYEFLHEDVEKYFNGSISVHEVGIQDILRIRAMQEQPFLGAAVVGIEPASLGIGIGLTDVVATAVPDIEQRIVERLRAWGVVVEAKDATTNAGCHCGTSSSGGN